MYRTNCPPPIEAPPPEARAPKPVSAAKGKWVVRAIVALSVVLGSGLALAQIAQATLLFDLLKPPPRIVLFGP